MDTFSDQADAFAVVTITDEAEDANIARVQIDASKWAAGKLRPKVYGDKLQASHSLDEEQAEGFLGVLKALGKASRSKDE